MKLNNVMGLDAVGKPTDPDSRPVRKRKSAPDSGWITELGFESYLTPEQVAKILSCSREQVRRLIEYAGLPALDITIPTGGRQTSRARRWRVDMDELMAWIEERKELARRETEGRLDLRRATQQAYQRQWRQQRKVG